MALLIDLVVIDDHAIVRQGFIELLASEPTVRVVGDAGDVDTGLAVIRERRPTLVLSDVMFQGEPRGLELPSRLARAGAESVPVLFLSSFETLWYYQTALAAGGRGYLLKTADLDEILSAIHVVARGGAVFPAETMTTDARDRAPSIREREILRMVAAGAGNGEIGGALGISPRTVESHLGRLFERYGVTSRTELALLAVESGWISRKR